MVFAWKLDGKEGCAWLSVAPIVRKAMARRCRIMILRNQASVSREIRVAACAEIVNYVIQPGYLRMTSIACDAVGKRKSFRGMGHDKHGQSADSKLRDSRFDAPPFFQSWASKNHLGTLTLTTPSVASS